MVTIKDAKLTLAEKIGNIGGTFGVFVGLSTFVCWSHGFGH